MTVRYSWAKRMRRKLWITVSLILMLVLRLSKSQPNENLAQLTRLQRYLIALYQQFRRNVSAVVLEHFMDPQLMRLTNGIIVLIRGWSPNPIEESINARMSMDYIRSNVLYMCIMYVDSWYDSYSNAGGIDADAILYATEIYRIRSNFLWTTEPNDEIVRFELAQFFRFSIEARVLNNTPYVQLFPTCTESARFFDDMFAPNTGSSFFSLNFMPLNQNPQSNLLREVEMLTDAQNLVLRWNDLRDEGTIPSTILLRNQLFFLNEKFRYFLRRLIESFLVQCNLTSLLERRKSNAFALASLLVLQRYVRFTLAEYDRHVCHPAHIRYTYVLSANITTILRENHIRLVQAYQNLNTALNLMTYNDNFLFAFHSHVSILPLRVGYVRHNEQLSLRVDISCQNQSEN